jgi:hypothetical protein
MFIPSIPIIFRKFQIPDSTTQGTQALPHGLSRISASSKDNRQRLFLPSLRATRVKMFKTDTLAYILFIALPPTFVF